MSAMIRREGQPLSIDTILTAPRTILVDELNVAVPFERLHADAPLKDFNMTGTPP